MAQGQRGAGTAWQQMPATTGTPRATAKGWGALGKALPQETLTQPAKAKLRRVNRSC